MSARALIIHLLVALQTNLVPPSVAAPVPPEMEKFRMGILKLGEENDPGSDRAFPLLEKRVQRWLENLESLPTKAQPLPVSVPEAVAKDQTTAEQLRHSTELLEKWLSGEGASVAEN